MSLPPGTAGCALLTLLYFLFFILVFLDLGMSGFAWLVQQEGCYTLSLTFALADTAPSSSLTPAEILEDHIRGAYFVRGCF
jgi:hypothetical protein